MSYANLALEGFYTKCGVPLKDAKVVSSLYGDNYLQIQTTKREEGFGKKSKADAALEIAEFIIGGASLYSDFPPIWEDVDNYEDLLRAISIVKSAAKCSVCVYAYHGHTHLCDIILESFRDFLYIADNKFPEWKGKIDVRNELDDYENKLNKLNISSEAFGKRRGFFSKLFG